MADHKGGRGVVGTGGEKRREKGKEREKEKERMKMEHSAAEPYLRTDCDGDPTRTERRRAADCGRSSRR